MENEYKILLYYKYVSLSDPEFEKERQFLWCQELGLKGRIIVACEGINGTVEGEVKNVEEYKKRMREIPEFSDIHFKESKGSGNAFPKLSVKVRDEIVSLKLGEKNLDPNDVTGKHLPPEELKKWFDEDRDFVIIDMRNDYEHRVGYFDKSVFPPISNFRELKENISSIEEFKNKTVVPICTGGVRCEKASGLLIKEGFQDVYQLDGGMVSYLEKFPNKYFKGKVYVFDGRILVGYGENEPDHVIVGRCDLCDDTSENYVNCKNKKCNKHFICCETCVEKNGGIFCSQDCKEKVLVSTN